MAQADLQDIHKLWQPNMGHCRLCCDSTQSSSNTKGECVIRCAAKQAMHTTDRARLQESMPYQKYRHYLQFGMCGLQVSGSAA